MSILFDTHAAIWLLQGDSRLGTGVLERLRGETGSPACISDIVLLETSMLLAKGRVVVRGDPASFLRQFARRFHILPIDADIATIAMEVSLEQADPFDRVITATALQHRLPLASRDTAIRDSGLVEVIW